MAKEKTCLNCRKIHSESKCPNCGEIPTSDSFKGRIHIFNSKESEMASRMKINNDGDFSIKTK